MSKIGGFTQICYGKKWDGRYRFMGLDSKEYESRLVSRQVSKLASGVFRELFACQPHCFRRGGVRRDSDSESSRATVS